MKRYLQSKWFKVPAVLVGMLSAAWAVGAAWDTYKVAEMTEKMKTICMGRMTIDLPGEAEVELFRTRISGLEIGAFAESPEAFQARVAAREAEIRATPDRLGGHNNMESVRDITTQEGLSGKMFVHGRYVTEGDAYNAVGEEHYRYEDIALEAHVHGKGISIDLEVKKYDPDRMQNLSRLLAQLVPNPANRMPTEPGFCFDHAYIRDPLRADDIEQITMAVKLPSRPDIGIHFDTIAGTKPDPLGLLKRNAESRARLPAILNMRVTDLRAAPRTIGGLTGDELAQRVIEENLAIVYGFNWEVNGTEDNVLVPDLTLTMVTGRGEDGPVRSSLSEPAALALWDKIVSSVRVRGASSPRPAAPMK
jgi:hypothetical protein